MMSTKCQHKQAALAGQENVMLELPFYPSDQGDWNLPSVDELLLNGQLDLKYPADGFVGFHSLTICSSNARQMAKYLTLSMGFEEVAYRGLETNSRRLASHVVRNGKILFEIVNTLETVKEDFHDIPMTKEECLKTNLDFSFEQKKLFQDVKENVADLVEDIVDSSLRRYKHSINVKKTKEKLKQSIISSSSFQKSLQDIKKSLANCIDVSKQSIDENFESFMVQDFVKNHGEGVRDVSFEVVNVDQIFNRAIDAGAHIIRLPKIMSDANGSVKVATVSIPGTDIQHTLVQKIDYSGPFLPTYTDVRLEKLSSYLRQLLKLPKVNFECIDHCVENYTWNQMMDHARLYAKIFGFRKYWSVDEQDVFTGNTALRSIVMASSNGKIKMPINEPAKSKMKGQIEEFYDYNGGPGVQHIAIRTYDIISTVESLKKRGIDFNPTPKSYYDNLRARLINDDIILFEDFSKIEDLSILVDYDSSTRNKTSKTCNYILQIFTKPLHDRPTLFMEIIQRHHHNGFGKGTFKGLFESIEAQQRLRGTLVPVDN